MACFPQHFPIFSKIRVGDVVEHPFLSKVLCDLETPPISDFSPYPTVFRVRSSLATTLPYLVESIIQAICCRELSLLLFLLLGRLSAQY